MSRLSANFHHHARFYAAAGAGLAAFAAMRVMGFHEVPLLLGGDVFFLSYLIMGMLVVRESADEMARRADSQDEGIGIVVLMTLATMSYFCVAVFTAINAKAAPILPLALAAAGAPLGWFVLNMVMGYHYANLHYFDDPQTTSDDTRDLDFPGCDQPGPWDFLYFSFVIGMTCQVSDVQVKTSVMRRAVLGHGLAAFFFNTVFIAMAVNAAVAMAA